MAKGTHPTIPAARLSTLGQSRKDKFPGALAVLAMVIFFSSLVLLYFFRNSPAEGVVDHCDQSAAIAANLVNENTGRGKTSRLEGQQAFLRCMDESSQTPRKSRP